MFGAFGPPTLRISSKSVARPTPLPLLGRREFTSWVVAGTTKTRFRSVYVEGFSMIGPEFVTAGRAVFTVSNGSGEHYTYRVTRKEKDGREGDYVYFVNLLSGCDNDNDYTYLGVFEPGRCEVRLTRKSKLSEESKPVAVVRWALRRVWAGDGIPPGYQIQHAGKCGRCGRTLTVPESIETGLGPQCAGRVNG